MSTSRTLLEFPFDRGHPVIVQPYYSTCALLTWGLFKTTGNLQDPEQFEGIDVEVRHNNSIAVDKECCIWVIKRALRSWRCVSCLPSHSIHGCERW